MAIRWAKFEDIQHITSIGDYDQAEIEEWIEKTDDNILLVLEVQGKFAGFLFCKIMSHSWAMLDCFYIPPEFRNLGRNGKLLIDALIDRLRKRKILHLSTLIDLQDTALARIAKIFGFGEQKTYLWHEIEVK